MKIIFGDIFFLLEPAALGPLSVQMQGSHGNESRDYVFSYRSNVSLSKALNNSEFHNDDYLMISFITSAYYSPNPQLILVINP